MKADKCISKYARVGQQTSLLRMVIPSAFRMNSKAGQTPSSYTLLLGVALASTFTKHRPGKASAVKLAPAPANVNVEVTWLLLHVWQ